MNKYFLTDDEPYQRSDECCKKDCCNEQLRLGCVRLCGSSCILFLSRLLTMPQRVRVTIVFRTQTYNAYPNHNHNPFKTYFTDSRPHFLFSGPLLPPHASICLWTELWMMGRTAGVIIIFCSSLSLYRLLSSSFLGFMVSVRLFVVTQRTPPVKIIWK